MQRTGILTPNEAEIARLKNELLEKNRKAEEVRKRFDHVKSHWERERKDLIRSAEENEKKIGLLRTERDTFQQKSKKNERERQKLEEAGERLLSAYWNKERELESTRQRLREKINRLEQENSVLQREWNQESNELEDVLEEKQKNIVRQSEEKKQLEDEKNGITKLWTKTRKQARKIIKELKERIQEQNQQLHQKSDQYQEQKKKVDIRLRNARENSRRLVRDKEKDLKELEVEKDDIIAKLEKKLAISENKAKKLTNQRDRVCKKLETLKNKQQGLKSVAKSKKICLSLIKYENITDRFLNEGDETLVKAIGDTSNSLMDVISKAQKLLVVQDLTQIATTHPMPEGKTLRDLIDFYNITPPQRGNNQPTIITQTREIDKEIKVEVEKPVVKEVDKIIEVESQEQKKEIIRLKNIIKELEGNLSQYNCEKIVVPDRKSNNTIILVICLILLTLILTSQIILAKKKKKKKNQVNSRTTEVVYYNDQK